VAREQAARLRNFGLIPHQVRDFSVIQDMQTTFQTFSAFCSMGTGGSFSGAKVARA